MEHAALVHIVNADINIAERLRLAIPQFRMRRGTIGVILGPNGSGKSTLGRYICRINGAERVTAAREVRPDPAAVMVWQSLNLFPLSVRRNIEIVQRTGGDAALKYFRLWVLRNDHADSLSGGERQKLALVRSLVTESDLLVLDEPTSSLDSVSVHELVQAIGAYTSQHFDAPEDYLRNLSRLSSEQSARSVLVISHDIRFVRMLARYSSFRLFTLSEDLRRYASEDRRYVLHSGEAGEGLTIDEVHSAPPDLFSADFFGIANIIGFTGAVERPRGPEDLCDRYASVAEGWVVLSDSTIKVWRPRPEAVERSETVGLPAELPLRPADRSMEEVSQAKISVQVGGVQPAEADDGGAKAKVAPTTFRGNIIGLEYVGPHRRCRISVFGNHGPLEITIPAEAVSLADGNELMVSVDLSNNATWSIVGATGAQSGNALEAS